MLFAFLFHLYFSYGSPFSVVARTSSTTNVAELAAVVAEEGVAVAAAMVADVPTQLVLVVVVFYPLLLIPDFFVVV